MNLFFYVLMKLLWIPPTFHKLREGECVSFLTYIFHIVAIPSLTLESYFFFLFINLNGFFRFVSYKQKTRGGAEKKEKYVKRIFSTAKKKKNHFEYLLP